MNSTTTTNKPEVKATGMQGGSQMRITPEEIELVKRSFKGNDALLLLLRKLFLPEIDPKAPVGQVIDLWMTIDAKSMTPEQAYVNLLARNTLISHVDQQLMALRLMSNTENTNPDEVAAKVKANSTK